MADRLRKGIKSLPDLDKRQLEQLEENEQQAKTEAWAETKAGANAVLEALLGGSSAPSFGQRDA